MRVLRVPGQVLRRRQDIPLTQINDQMYEWVKKNLPIPTVDGLIMGKGGVLLLRRKNEPEAGKWWTPGGRIHLGETTEQALTRIIKAETGIQVEVLTVLGLLQLVSPFSHTVGPIYYCFPVGDEEVTLDGQHDDYMWATECTDAAPTIRNYVDNALRFWRRPETLRRNRHEHTVPDRNLRSR